MGIYTWADNWRVYVCNSRTAQHWSLHYLQISNSEDYSSHITNILYSSVKIVNSKVSSFHQSNKIKLSLFDGEPFCDQSASRFQCPDGWHPSEPGQIRAPRITDIAQVGKTYCIPNSIPVQIENLGCTLSYEDDPKVHPSLL